MFGYMSVGHSLNVLIIYITIFFLTLDMRQAMAVLLIASLSAMAVAAPTAAMASDETSDDMPRLVITVVCTIYSDHLDEAVTGMDLALGINLGQYMPDCEMTTEYIDAVQMPSVTVDMPEGALFPACADANDCFVPHTITVEPGTDVTWTNSDTVLHTVTEPGGLFDSWLLPGEEFTFTFETPGTHVYGCTVHPWASGVVVVEADGAGEPGPAAAEPEPAMPEPAAEPPNPVLAQDIVERMIGMYKENGVGAFEEINANADPDTAVVGFVVDANKQILVAHGANPLYVGLSVQPVLDAAFIPLEVMLQIIEEEDDGVWLSYPFADPQGNVVGYERGWFKEHDGYIFAGRYGVTDQERVQSIVVEMIRLYGHDPEGAFDTINSFGSQDPRYPFVVDPETTKIVAHGADASRVGDVAIILTNSTVSLEEFRSLNEDEGVWTEYVFFNPATGLDASKRSWVAMHDGYLFGSGYYP